MIKDKDKTLDELEKAIKVWEESKSDCLKTYLTAQKKLHRATSKLETLRNLKDEKILAQKDLEKPDWTWLLDSSNRTDASHKEAYRQLAKLGLNLSGYLPKTKQSIVQLSVSPEATDETLLEKQRNIESIIPFLKPLEDGDLEGAQVIYFGLMEDTLARYCAYSIRRVVATGCWVLLSSTYGRVKQETKVPTLLELLKYIRTYHPYS